MQKFTPRNPVFLISWQKTKKEGIAIIRDLLSYLPSNNLEETPIAVCNDPIDRLEDRLNEIIPDNPNLPYNMMDVIEGIVDNGKFLEVHKTLCS